MTVISSRLIASRGSMSLTLGTVPTARWGAQVEPRAKRSDEALPARERATHRRPADGLFRAVVSWRGSGSLKARAGGAARRGGSMRVAVVVAVVSAEVRRVARCRLHLCALPARLLGGRMARARALCLLGPRPGARRRVLGRVWRGLGSDEALTAGGKDYDESGKACVQRGRDSCGRALVYFQKARV